MIDFKEMIAARHVYAKKWKEKTGGKVLGYFEPYMPEEIAYAAGILPVRILAEHEDDDISDKWIYGSCYPVRDMVNQVLKGRYDYLDGLVNVEGCQWMFHGFEVIMNNRPELFYHYFFMPDYTDAPTSKDVARSEMHVFKQKMEEWTGQNITVEALDSAIAVYNKNRRLLRRMYELRRKNNSVILGSEAMQIVLACQVMDKAEANEILERYLDEIEDREPYEDRIRLMLVGSETFNTDLEELVERLGANVVIDELDTGSSYFWNETIEQKDRLMALSLRYLGRPHNPIKDNNWRRRIQHIFELTEDYNVDGVIIEKQIYCHLHGSDNYAVWKMLRERNIPFLYFERDMKLQEEDTSMRIEAFINMLRPGVTHLAGWNRVFGGQEVKR
ncbi:MAG: 2-hydroxyacyl-CoA dehydratase [Clostridiales bacterium]|nr:2-hydroxyacyl-CoA dehydratase [Clostridiales bacterium]